MVSQQEDATRHLIIQKRDSLDKKGLLEAVTRAIDEAPEIGTFVFVHGFNVPFDDAILRTAQLAWDMKFKGPAITYSWPSAAVTRGYVSDIDMADWTAPHLSSFLQDLRAHTGKRTVHLVAHSMGSRILSVALDRLSLTQPKTIDHFQEVVLAAPDINTKVLSQLSVALRSEADRVTIYASGRDRALQFSDFLRTFWRERSPRVGSKATEINLPQFDIIDATRARFSLIGHSYFAEDTLLLNDISLLLKQRLKPDDRSITLDKVGNMWVLKP